MDYRKFFENNMVYKKDLSVLASIYATLAYHNNIKLTNGCAITGGIEAFAGNFGFSDIENYKLDDYYSDDDISEAIVGHRLVEYKGEKKEIILIDVRGTNGTNEEWSSNFDVGSNTDNYYDLLNADWKNKENHKGFDVAANRIYNKLENYIYDNVNASAQKVVYTFASPQTTTSSRANATSSSIFNIVNADDLIPMLPLENWGFKRYGITRAISLEDNYEDKSPFGNSKGTFEWLTGKDYNNTEALDSVIKAFTVVASNRDELYVLDTSSDGTVNPNNKVHATQNGAQKELNEIN